MSEALNKVSSIKQLPIFPLPLVMLPNELLPLHIFEDRYRKMLTDVEQTGKLFGVMLFEAQESFIEKPPVGSIGCVAEIRESELLPDGRSNIMALGVVRYRLLDYVESDEPYLVGDVHFFEDDEEIPSIVEPLADKVFVLFERMAKAAFKMSSNRQHQPEVKRTDPESLSFLITAAFNFNNEQKYKLLELTSTVERLNELKEALDQIVVQLEESAEIHSRSRSNGHSKKKIDL